MILKSNLVLIPGLTLPCFLAIFLAMEDKALSIDSFLFFCQHQNLSAEQGRQKRLESFVPVHLLF